MVWQLAPFSASKDSVEKGAEPAWGTQMAFKFPRVGRRVGQPAVFAIEDMFRTWTRDLGAREIRESRA